MCLISARLGYICFVNLFHASDRTPFNDFTRSGRKIGEDVEYQGVETTWLTEMVSYFCCKNAKLRLRRGERDIYSRWREFQRIE